ncbi:MAG TPA: hypothetical protein VIJ79_17110 [Acidobacteriaceae bacterium]
MNTVSLIASVLGMILGTAGLSISLSNYLRDRPKIRVTLKWDMTDAQTGQMFGLAKVTNVGRRPVFISVVALELPKGFARSDLILDTSMAGTKLSEGDKPIAHIINQTDLAQYSVQWQKIRAYAEDSTNRSYFSKPPKKNSKKPSWVVP